MFHPRRDQFGCWPRFAQVATLASPQRHEIGQAAFGGGLAQILSQQQLQGEARKFGFVSAQFVGQTVAQHPATAARENAAQSRGNFAALAKQRLVGGMRAAFRARQKSRTHLHAGRAQDPNGGNAPSVHDATSSDNGNGDMFSQQRRQGENADQTLLRVTDEGAAMTTGLGPLRDDAIYAAFLQHDGFQHMGGGAQGENPSVPQQIQIHVVRGAKGKAQGRHTRLQQHVQLLLEHRRLGWHRWGRRQSQFSAVWRQ